MRQRRQAGIGAVLLIGALASGLWSTPAYWNGNVYMWASGDALKVFPLTNGVLATRSSVQSSATSGFPGATPVISSNGTENGIVWALAMGLLGGLLPALRAARVPVTTALRAT